MATDELEVIRALLTSKPRPEGWSERRERLDELGSVWPVAGDITLEPVDMDGMPGEWSMAPGSDASRVLIYFHGGGYCSGSIRSHRRMVTESRLDSEVAATSSSHRAPASRPAARLVLTALLVGAILLFDLRFPMSD